MVAIEDTYVAYCFDQAIGYLGSVIEGELEEAGRSRASREETQTKMARERVIKKHFGQLSFEKEQFADPAALFAQS